MPLSMRRQTARLKQSQTRRQNEEKRRQHALELLESKTPVSEIVAMTKLNRSMVYRIRHALSKPHSPVLNRLLKPTEFFRGRKPVLSATEESMIVERAIFAAERGFAYGDYEMKAAMAQIANDGRAGYKNNLPSDYALRSFRARNRSITYRRTENIDNSRLAAQDPKHIQTLVDVIERIKKQMPDIFSDPNRVWNLDETKVCGSNGRRYRGFSSAESNNGGYRLKLKDNGKHLTAIVTIAASGVFAPLYLIAEGKRTMPAWYRPVTPHQKTLLPNEYGWLASEEWVPKETKIVCSAKGSITKELLPSVITHLNRFARHFVPPEKSILLFIDGHSSRKGTEWLEEARKCNIEVIKLPANTSHFLQPCDDRVNKVFAESIRNVLDVFLYSGAYLNANIALKVKLAVAAYRSLNARNVVASFDKCGLWPLNNDKILAFAKWKKKESKVGKSVTSERRTTRKSDAILFGRVKEVSRTQTDPAKAISEIETMLQENPSTNSVLWRPHPIVIPTKALRRKGKGAAPALWLSEKENMPDIQQNIKSSQEQENVRSSTGSVVAAAALNSSSQGNRVVVVGGDGSISVDCEDLKSLQFDDVPIKKWKEYRRQRRQSRRKDKRKKQPLAAASALLELKNVR